MTGPLETEHAFQPPVAAEAGTIIEYHGRLTKEITFSLLDTTADRLQCAGEDLRTRRTILRMMVESLQNIVMHRDPHTGSTDAVSAELFALRKQGGLYVLVAGNPVAKNAVPQLVARLEQLNRLNRLERKHLYRRLLATAGLSAKEGGLGFVDIARRSGGKLRFDFHEISDEHCFFRLTMALARGEDPELKKIYGHTKSRGNGRHTRHPL